MTNQNIFDYVRAWTNTNTGTLPNATLFLFLNERNRQFCAALQGVREDFLGERSTTDLIGNQQEYQLPDDCMRLKKLECTFDGTTWRAIKFFDINERPRFGVNGTMGGEVLPTDATTVSQNYSVDYPFADVLENSLFLYPIPSATVSQGLKLYYFKRPQDMTTTNASADLPKEYHSYLVESVTLDVEVTKGKLAASVGLEKQDELIQLFKRTVAPRNDGEPVVIRGAGQSYR